MQAASERQLCRHSHGLGDGAATWHRLQWRTLALKRSSRRPGCRFQSFSPSQSGRGSSLRQTSITVEHIPGFASVGKQTSMRWGACTCADPLLLGMAGGHGSLPRYMPLPQQWLLGFAACHMETHAETGAMPAGAAHRYAWSQAQGLDQEARPDGVPTGCSRATCAASTPRRG